MTTNNKKFPLHLIVAGFGGQGVLLAGKLVAEAGLQEGREVSWIPSYGPEVRGGTANCTVILSDKEIGSPVVENPDVIMIMNRPSMDKFLPKLVPGGICIYNKSIIEGFTPRSDVKMYPVPASEIADKVGSTKLLNMVMVGTFMESTKAFTEKSLSEALHHSISAKHANMIPMNEKAISEGSGFAKTVK
ncbi:MAG: 2-oxoacid:acceptor oxidoreductase family protein [Candidatus Wallbacteria bacterium]